ncbi:hypothetical protein IJZ97_05175, partial [bacterium]|nr:hypothetical protein [bacterium]
MIVTGISNRYTIKPVFTPTNIERKTYLPVQKNDVYTPTFQSTLDDKIDKSYDKLTKQLGIINGLDVALMANRIQTKVPEVSKENIYYALGVLSQYSSYKSWTNLERGFDQIGVKGLDNLNLYENNEVPVYLNTVISYLAEKNYSNILPKFERQNNAVILDSKLLAAMEKKPEILNYIKKCDYTPIYIDNFENGY